MDKPLLICQWTFRWGAGAQKGARRKIERGPPHCAKSTDFILTDLYFQLRKQALGQRPSSGRVCCVKVKLLNLVWWEVTDEGSTQARITAQPQHSLSRNTKCLRYATNRPDTVTLLLHTSTLKASSLHTRHAKAERECSHVDFAASPRDQTAWNTEVKVSRMYSLISSCLWMRPLQRSL